MKKYLLSIGFLILGVVFIVHAAWDGATNYPAALDDDASLYDVEDNSTVEDEHHDALAQAIIAIETLIGTSPTDHCVMVGSGASPFTVLGVGATKEVLKGVTGADPDFVTERAFTVLDKAMADETNTQITEAQILAAKYITNQGSTDEADLILPDLEYYVSIVFIVNEALIIEINPPNADAHEAFDLDGTVLDASDCVDSPVTIGAKLAATRMQIADGTWKWSLDTVRGAWVDGAASD